MQSGRVGIWALISYVPASAVIATIFLSELQTNGSFSSPYGLDLLGFMKSLFCFLFTVQKTQK